MTRRILIVEDDPRWQRILGQIVEDMGYRVLTAAHLSEARQCLESLQFDLVLVDIDLDGSGLAGEGGRLFDLLCKQYPQVPVIAITGIEVTTAQMRKLFVKYGISDFIDKGSFDVMEFKELICKKAKSESCIDLKAEIHSKSHASIVNGEDTQVTQGFGTPPTNEIERGRLDVSSAIRQLANLIRTCHETGNSSYTLLLGSSLSLTPEVRQAVCGSDDWEAFWTAIQGLSAAERRALLASPLGALNLTAGYRYLAELAQAGYFYIILTANIDAALDNALRILTASECQVLCHGQISAQEIAAALSRPAPRVKAIKLRGDISDYRLPLTPEGQFEFPEALEETMEQMLSQDTILVGDIPHDTDIQRCIRQGEGALWVVVPEKPRPGSFLYNAKRARPRGEVISGPEAEFVSFFAALARDLER